MSTRPPDPSRRAFLESASAALLAPAAATRAEPDLEPVRVLVIGTGARGSDLVRGLSTIEGAEIVGVCDDYGPHLVQGAKYAGPGAQTFSDHRVALDRLRPRAVVIAVPLALHHPIARDALDAGCAVFCEKTMCHDLDQARALAREVEASGQVFQVGLQRRASPVYQQAAAMVRGGVLGQVSAIQAQWHRHNDWRRPVPVPRTDPNWPALERRLNWRLYRASSAGLMAELGSHQLDVANWLLGTTPKRVTASAGIDYWRDGREVFDNIACVYEYGLKSAGGPSPYTVRVTYSSLCNNAYEGASELVLGTRGSLYLTTGKGLYFREAADAAIWSTGPAPDGRAEAQASLLTAGKTLKLSDSPWAHRGTPVEIDPNGADETRAELVSFLDHVRRRDPKTLVDVRAGLLNTATVLIANQAAETGRAVDFPADLA